MCTCAWVLLPAGVAGCAQALGVPTAGPLSSPVSISSSNSVSGIIGGKGSSSSSSSCNAAQHRPTRRVQHQRRELLLCEFSLLAVVLLLQLLLLAPHAVLVAAQEDPIYGCDLVVNAQQGLFSVVSSPTPDMPFTSDVSAYGTEVRTLYLDISDNSILGGTPVSVWSLLFGGGLNEAAEYFCNGGSLPATPTYIAEVQRRSVAMSYADLGMSAAAVCSTPSKDAQHLYAIVIEVGDDGVSQPNT